MPNLQDYVNRNNAVTAYSPTRVLDRPRANAGTAQRILQQRAAPAQYQPQTQGFQLGQTPAQPMPQTGAVPTAPAPVRSLAEMLDHIQGAPAVAPEQEGPGGWKGYLGTAVNNPIGKAIMAPLRVLGYPHDIVVSGVNELADAFNGGDASWSDFIRQTSEGIGFGDVVGSTGNIWADRAIGFIGDVALDPMTYVFGSGILAGAGREARLGLASRVFELTGEEALSARVAKLGLHALDDAKRAELAALSREAGGMFVEGAEKIKRAGYYFRAPFTEAEFRLPASATIDRVLGGGFARARSGLAASPLGGWFRNRKMEEGLVEAADRLLTGRGGQNSLALSTALETINANQAYKLGKRFTARTAEAELAATLREIPRGMSMADYTELVERTGGQRGNTMMERFAKMLEEAGIRHGRVGPETEGGVHYFPRYMTQKGKAWYTGIEESMGGKIFGAGNSLDEYSPSLMTRHLTGGDVKIKDLEFHFPANATTRDFNTEFRRVTGSNFDLFEEDFAKATKRYIQNLADDVGRRTVANRLVKSKGGLVRSYGDHEAVKEIVDDVNTKLLTEKAGQALKDELNTVGTNMDEIRNEVARNLRGISSGFLKPRFQQVIDDLTALTAQQRQFLTDSLDQDIRFSALLGRSTYGAAPGSAPGFGTLDAALERIWNDTAAEVARLGSERADAMRVLALQHDQLVGELAAVPINARNAEMAARTEARQRMRTAELAMLRLQQARSSVESLHNLINEARIKSEAAGRLADDAGFLSLFLPGQAEARRAEVDAARQALAPDARTPVYDRPEMSTEAITGHYNRQREIAFGAQARQQVDEIAKRSEAFVKSRREMEAYVATHSSALEGARLKLEGDSHALAVMRMRRDDLIGIAEKRAEKNALEEQMREFELGQFAQSRDDYDKLRKELDSLRETAEADARSLAEAHNELTRTARQIDETQARAAANDLGTVPQAPVHPPLTMEPAAAAAARADRAALQAEQKAFADSTEGAKYLVLTRRREQAAAEQTAANEVLELASGKNTRYLFDESGNVRLRTSNSVEGYNAALELQDVEREYQLLKTRIRAAESTRRETLIRNEANELSNAEAARIDRKAEAELNELRQKLGETARRRTAANERVKASNARGVVTNVELTQREIERITAAAIKTKRMQAVLDDLDSKLTSYDHVQTRATKIADLDRDLAQHARQVAERKGRDQAYADAVRAFEAGPQPAKTLPFTGGQPLPWGADQGMGPFERQARDIAQKESDELSRSARFLGWKTKWEDVPQITDAEALGLRGLTPDQRLAWNQATAIIRERDVFTGGATNPIVVQARQTISNLRAEMGRVIGSTDQQAVNRLERMYDQLDMLAEARGAFDPTAVQRAAIEGKVKLPQALAEYEAGLGERELARGTMSQREEAMRALAKGAGKGKAAKQNVSYEIADRARRSYRLARYMRDTHMPTLVERGALPEADSVLGRVDVAEYITNSIADLGQALEHYGANPTSFAVNRLEQKAADVNRMAEFMVRYNRAIETGVEPSDSVAAYLLTVQLGRESETLGKQIERATKALDASTPSVMYRRWQATFGTKLPEELQAARLTGEQMEELRHLSKTIPLEDQIATDERLITELEARKLDGTWDSAAKSKVTVARNRIDRNKQALAQLAQQAPSTNGTINELLNRVVTEIESQIHELDWAVTDFNDARHMVRDAQAIGEHRVRLEAAIERGDGMLSEFDDGATRLRNAVAAAEADGTGVVSYTPLIQDNFLMTVEQARNALDSGEVPAYLRSAYQAAIDRAERGAEGVNVTSIQRVREELARLDELATLTGEQQVRRRGLQQRVASFEERSAQVVQAGETVRSLEAKRRLGERLTNAEQRDFDAAQRLVASDEQRAARSTLKPKRQRKVSNPAIQAYAELHGVDPTHVISTNQLRQGQDVVQIPLADAIKMADDNDRALESLRAAQGKRQMRLAALDGTINKDLRLQRAVIADQMGETLPDPKVLQRTIDEINARARRRRAPGRETYQPDQLAEAMAAAERPVDPTLTSGKLFPHEKDLVNLTQGRIDAIRQFGNMTPEQLSAARNHLDEMTKVIDETRGMLGDHFDLAAATADHGAQFLSDLVGGHMELTSRGLEALHSIYGPEAGEQVGVFINALHGLMGVEGPTAEDMRTLLAQFNRPPVTGPAASLLWRTTDPSLEDLRQLREAILNIPNAEMDEVRAANRIGWLQGIDELLQPRIPAGKVLSADEVGEVFRGLGMVLGDDVGLLREAESHVMNMISGGELITDDTLRDAFRDQLTAAAKAHHSDELKKSTDLITMLGLSFAPGTPGFNGKLQSLGYSMSRQALDRQKLRRFVVDSFSRIGILADETARERLITLTMRRKRVDDMRIGLGAVVKDLPMEDPRLAFEALGQHSMDAVADFDRQLSAFRAGVLPEGVEDKIIDRAAKLEEQMQRAVEANDYDRINEIREMQDQLDDRALTQPGEPPPGGEPTPEAPQVDYATQLNDAETKAANAHDTLNNAQLALNQAKETQAGAQVAEVTDPGLIPELQRHPDTPEGKISHGEVLLASLDFDRELEAAAGHEAAEIAAINHYQDIVRQAWEGEPKASVKAASDAWAEFQRGGSAPGRTTNELDAAQSAFDQAKAAADEADSAVTKLRQTGPAETVAPETPSKSLGEVDAAAHAQDPDQLLDWNSASQAYDEAVARLQALDEQDLNLDQINNLPAAERDEAQAVMMDAAEQERAVAAARVRKLGQRRAELWPQERARLEVARREAQAQALKQTVIQGETVPQRAVTWQWAQVLTKGTPSVDVLRRGRGIPSQTMVEAGQQVGKIGNIVADVTGIRSSMSGPFRQGAMPAIESRLEAQLAPVDAMKASLRQARDTAATERSRLETLANAYTGDPASIDAEIAARQAEAAEAQAFLSGVPGATTAAEMEATLRPQIADTKAAAVEADRAAAEAMAEQQARWEAAQRVYTDAVATADRGLSAVRTRIVDTEASLARDERALARAKALDFQGVNGSDFRQHWNDLRDLNESRREIVRQGPPRPGGPLPPPTREVGGPELFDDLNDINMIQRLLAGADDQLRQLEGVELSHAEIVKRLKDFESGATGVADVMKFQIRDGWVPMIPRLAQGSDALYIRTELHRAINNLYEAQRRPQTWSFIADSYTQFFKTYATATPGFHIRNWISGVFMNLVDGVRIREMRRSGGIWKDFLKDPINYFDNAEPDVQRALQAVFGSGAAGRFAEGEVGNVGRGHILNNAFTRWNQRRGANVEGSLRLAMALDSVHKGMNLGAAMDRITRYHFDYSSLSSLDHQARKLIPFWTFISRNIPLQIESMWARPRTYLQYQHFVRNFGEAADPLTPDYWLSQGAFTMDPNAAKEDSPWYLAPDLPFLRVAEPFVALAQGDVGRATAGSVNINPAIAAPLEAFAFGRKLYTGQDINKEYNEPTAAMRPLMGLLGALGGTREGGTSGDQLLDDRYAHVLRSTIPTLNLIERLFNNEGVRTGRQDETVARALGLPVLQLTPELRESTRKGAYYDARDEMFSQADLARK